MCQLIDWLVLKSPEFRKRRLPSLYSDFRSAQNTNPDGYAANVAAWYDGLARSASCGLLPSAGGATNLLILDVNEGLRQFLGSDEFGQPQALGCAITEAISRRELILVRNYLSKESNVYQRPWVETTLNVVGWAMRRMGKSFAAQGEDTMPVGQYVITRNVEKAGAELMRRTADLKSDYDRVMLERHLLDKLGWKLTALDRCVLLKYLERDMGSITLGKDQMTVKIKAPGDAAELNALDLCISMLKLARSESEHRIEVCGQRESQLDVDIKEALRLNKRTKALHLLRLKKIVEKSVARHYGAIAQMEEITAKLRQAEEQVELLNIIKSSAAVLDAVNDQMKDFDQIARVKQRLEEGMATTDEIAAALTEVSGGLDEAGLDDELEAMENEAREAKEEEELARVQKQLDELSVVPQTSPEGGQTESKQEKEAKMVSG